MRESFRDESARKAISRIQRLPSQASAYRALADAVQSPRASVEGLAKIITGDVGMTAKVVQLVSSGFFGSPQRVNSAVEAVNLLGPETVRALLASSAAFQLGSEEYREEDLELLSEHSFAVAAAASRIATTLTDDPTWIGDAYLAGALHEVGTLALAGRGRRYSSETESAASRQRAAKGRIAQALPREAAPDPGGYLLALWGLPDSVVRAIAYHRAPDRCPEQISAPLTAVHIANALLGRSWDSGDGKTVPLAMDYLQGAGCADRLESWRDICEACRPEGALQ